MTTPVPEPMRIYPPGNQPVSLLASCSLRKVEIYPIISVESGWHYLGPAATNGSNDAVGIIVKDNSSDGSILRPIGDWVKVWDDSGSGKSNDYALWRGVPRDEDRVHYIVLGGFFIRSHNKPTTGESAGMKAIHKDFLKIAQAGREVWNDAGTGAKNDGAVWDISVAGTLDTINPGYFIPVPGHNLRPSETFGIDRNKVESGYVHSVPTYIYLLTRLVFSL